jgi:cyclic beta-1,2-glucan synthetase
VTRTTLYLGTLALVCAGLVWALLGVVQQARPTPSGDVALWAAGLAMGLVVSEAVIALVNRLISESVPPRHMPRLLLADGLPPGARVMVAIPCLLSHRSSIDTLVRRLQLHHLASGEQGVQFALLSDWLDADSACDSHDTALLEYAANSLRALNQRYPLAAGEPCRFVLLHRTRSFCTTQGRWLGWERKRGKIEQLVAALATDAAGPFVDLGDLSRLAPRTRYLLALDSDTHSWSLLE